MKKTAFLFAFLLVLATQTKAQQITISPAEDAVLCPGVDYEFTVNIPRVSLFLSIGVNDDPVPAIIVAYQYDLTLIDGNLSFKFLGRFVDENKTQVFTVLY